MTGFVIDVLDRYLPVTGIEGTSIYVWAEGRVRELEDALHAIGAHRSEAVLTLAPVIVPAPPDHAVDLFHHSDPQERSRTPITAYSYNVLGQHGTPWVQYSDEVLPVGRIRGVSWEYAGPFAIRDVSAEDER